MPPAIDEQSYRLALSLSLAPVHPRGVVGAVGRAVERLDYLGKAIAYWATGVSTLRGIEWYRASAGRPAAPPLAMDPGAVFALFAS